MDQRIIDIVTKEHTLEDYKYHISAVLKNGLKLAEIYNADKEIIELACLLHDIARAKGLKAGEENMHHISGAKKAEEILTNLKYSPDMIKKVVKCILAHRGGKQDYIPETIEEKIVANADAMAHFDSFLNLFSEFVSPENFEEGIKLIETKIERDWNTKLTLPEAKKLEQDNHLAIKFLLNNLKK